MTRPTGPSESLFSLFDLLGSSSLQNDRPHSRPPITDHPPLADLPRPLLLALAAVQARRGDSRTESDDVGAWCFAKSADPACGSGEAKDVVLAPMGGVGRAEGVVGPVDGQIE